MLFEQAHTRNESNLNENRHPANSEEQIEM